MKKYIFTIFFLIGSTLLAQEQLVGRWSGLGQNEQTKAFCEKSDLVISQDQNVMVVQKARFICSEELSLDLQNLEFHIDNGLLIYKNEIVGRIHGGEAEIQLPQAAVGNLEVYLSKSDLDVLLVRVVIGRISGNVYLTQSWIFSLKN